MTAVNVAIIKSSISLITQNGNLYIHKKLGTTMNYHVLEVCELKQEAKQRKIKMYYIMKKAQLIQLLSMKELPEKYIIEKKTIITLRAEAIARKFPSVYKMNRQALVELLYPHLYGETYPQKNNKNYNCTDKHYDPEKHNAK